MKDPMLVKSQQDSSPSRAGMILVKGGSFTMGSERAYPEEAPLRRVAVNDFWIDEVPVTNRDFAEFVAATGYVTVAEIAPDPKDYPGMAAEMAVPGSLVFRKTATPVDTSNPYLWWDFTFGADWRHPYGPESTLASLIHDARFRVRSGHLLRLAVLRGRPASLAFVSPHSD